MPLLQYCYIFCRRLNRCIRGVRGTATSRESESAFGTLARMHCKVSKWKLKNSCIVTTDTIILSTRNFKTVWSHGTPARLENCRGTPTPLHSCRPRRNTRTILGNLACVASHISPYQSRCQNRDEGTLHGTGAQVCAARPGVGGCNLGIGGTHETCSRNPV